MTSYISQLKNMFPAIDEESICSVLTHCRNDGITIDTVITRVYSTGGHIALIRLSLNINHRSIDSMPSIL